MSSLRSTAARGGAFTLASSVLNLVSQLVAMVTLGRLLTPADFGLVAVAMAIAGLTQAILYMGLSRAAVQAPELSRPAQSTLWLINVGLGLTMAAVLVLAAPALASAYDDPRLAGIFVVVASIPALLSLQVQSRVALIRAYRYGRLARAEVMASLISVAAGVALAFTGAGYWAIVAIPVVNVVVLCVAVPIAARWMPGAPGDRALVRGVVANGMRIAGVSVMENSSRFFLIPLIAAHLPAAVVGQFDRAQQTANLPLGSALVPLQRVGLPLFAAISDSRKRVGNAWFEVQSLFTLGVGLFFVVIGVTSRDVIVILLGPGWDLAGTLLGLLSVVALSRALALVPQWVLIGCGHSAALLRLSLWAQPLILGVSFAGVAWGAVGVASASALANAIYLPIVFWYTARQTGVPLRPLATHLLWLGATVLVPAGVAAVALSRLATAPVPSIALAGLGALLVLGGLAAVSPKHLRLFANVRTQVQALRSQRGGGDA